MNNKYKYLVYSKFLLLVLNKHLWKVNSIILKNICHKHNTMTIKYQPFILTFRFIFYFRLKLDLKYHFPFLYRSKIKFTWITLYVIYVHIYFAYFLRERANFVGDIVLVPNWILIQLFWNLISLQSKQEDKMKIIIIKYFIYFWFVFYAAKYVFVWSMLYNGSFCFVFKNIWMYVFCLHGCHMMDFESTFVSCDLFITWVLLNEVLIDGLLLDFNKFNVN